MGFRQLELELPTGYTPRDLEERAMQRLKGLVCPLVIERQSLDARKKGNIHWKIRLLAISPELPGPDPVFPPVPEIPRTGKKVRAVIAGTGPAGMAAALVLAESGAHVTLLERGDPVEDRAAGIARFEQGGAFSETGNYAFGEGGAGTFSDGKLTSRTKSIGPERLWFLDRLVQAGAPEEIRWLTHPHVGSDNLIRITRSFRERFLSLGGTILFRNRLEDLVIAEGRVTGAVTSSGVLEGTHFLAATGHSATDTVRMLLERGVPFRVKSTAIGFRAEHLQQTINRAQWGVSSLPGLKAAEYRLSAPGDVFTFCMCPGGRVVPAAPFSGRNCVNGMSLYARSGPFANAAVVAAVHPGEILGDGASPLAALEWIESLERNFFAYAGGYNAPAMPISRLIGGKSDLPKTSSFPFPLVPADFADLFPRVLLERISAALGDFDRKIRGYREGTLIGLESKTSSPVQVDREDDGTSGYPNLYVIGEGSGRSGGIVSSAADGIRMALGILERQRG